MHEKSDESQFSYYFYAVNVYTRYSGYDSGLTLKQTQPSVSKAEKMYFYVL